MVLIRLLLIIIFLITNAFAHEAFFKLKVFYPEEKNYSGTLLHKNINNGFIRELKFYDNNHILIGESYEKFDKDSNPIYIKKNDYRC